MQKLNVSETKTVAFYNKDDFLSYFTKLMDDGQTVGVDVAIENPEIDDPRATGSPTMYIVTVYKDLMLEE